MRRSQASKLCMTDSAGVQHLLVKSLNPSDRDACVVVSERESLLKCGD